EAENLDLVVPPLDAGQLAREVLDVDPGPPVDVRRVLVGQDRDAHRVTPSLTPTRRPGRPRTPPTRSRYVRGLDHNPGGTAGPETGSRRQGCCKLVKDQGPRDNGPRPLGEQGGEISGRALGSRSLPRPLIDGP